MLLPIKPPGTLSEVSKKKIYLSVHIQDTAVINCMMLWVARFIESSVAGDNPKITRLHHDKIKFTLLLRIVGLGRARPKCKKHPSVELLKLVGSCKFLAFDISSFILPSCIVADARTVGTLDTLCLRSRASSSFKNVRKKTCKVLRYGLAEEYSSHGQKLNIDD